MNPLKLLREQVAERDVVLDKAVLRVAELSYELARVRGALRDLLRDVDARLLLDSGVKGMGHNIAVESAGRLRVDAEYARRVLRGEGEK